MGGSEMMWNIYGLVDPTTGRVRYVGQTRRDPSTRLRQHVAAARLKGTRDNNIDLSEWITALAGAGFSPTMLLLGRARTQRAADEMEARFIERGQGLLNRVCRGVVHALTHERMSQKAHSRTRVS
jgi:hypothetical protein